MCNFARYISRILTVPLSLVFFVTWTQPLHAVQQVNVKLNHTLGANQRVLDFQVSPDGSRIVYRVARTLPPVQENPPPPAADLFSVPATGGAAMQLNPPATQDFESVEEYRFTPDGQEVIYLRTTNDASLGNVFELFRVVANGLAAATSVSGPISVGTRSIRDFEFTFEDATVRVTSGQGSILTINYGLHHANVPERITTISDGTSNTFFFGEQVNHLIQTPINGAPRRINPDMVEGGVVYDFEITPDGTRAIYLADQNLDGVIELFSIPADGSDVGFRISGPMVAGGDVKEFKVNATSTRAIYLADQTTNGIVELYSARTNGGIVTKLNAPLVTGGAVTQFGFSPDGSLVAYLADQIADRQFDLYAVSSGGSATNPLSRELPGMSVRSFHISPEGAHIFFVEARPSGALSLWSRPLALEPAALTEWQVPPVATIAEPDLKFSADGLQLVYLADAGLDGTFELVSISLTDPFSVTSPLNAPLASGGNIHGFQVSPDGQRVVYAADQNTPGAVELFSVPINGGDVEPVNGPLVNGGSVRAGRHDIQFSPDSRTVYYLADQDSDNVIELYAAYDAPEVAFTQSGYVVAEDGSLTPQLAVMRSGNLAASANVRVQLTGQPDGGTARGGASLGVAGIDFIDNVRDVAFASGEFSKTFAVAIKNDGVAEPAEDFTMQLFEPAQSVLSANDVAKVVILDNADSPLLEDVAFTLAENSPNDTRIEPQPGELSGTRVDAVAVTTYTILSGNTENAFRIDATGALIVNNSAVLNYETTPSFALIVQATADNGSSDIATWTVNLLDQNEAPTFASQVRSIAENSPNGRNVGSKLLASDPEGDPVTFTTASSVFGITINGQLFVANSRMLDFETQAQFIFQVTVGDNQGLSTEAEIRVNVLDVTEDDGLAPAITSLNPASVVAGGKSFKLIVAGKNLTANSIVRWNGSNRSTVLEQDRLIALISSQDIAAVTTAKVDVLDTKSGRTSETVPFPVTKGSVGIAALAIESNALHRSVVNQTTIFNLEWTHTSEPWRAMDEMDLRLVDGERIPLWLRYQETRDENGKDTSSIILLNPDGTPAGSGHFSEAKVLENETVRIDLAKTTFIGSGETGSNIRVRIPVVFKPAAVQSESYIIEMYGVDDLGEKQGPNVVGATTVTEPAIYLPAVRQ